MKKTLIMIVCILFIYFLSTYSVYAENKVKYSNDDGYYIIIDKDDYDNQSYKEGYIVYNVTEYSVPEAIWDPEEDIDLGLVAALYEQPVQKEELWWSQINYCAYGDSSGILVILMDFISGYGTSTSIFKGEYLMTDSMQNQWLYEIDDWDNKVGVLEWIFGGEATNCFKLTPENVPESNLIHSCNLYESYFNKITELLVNFKNSTDTSEKVKNLSLYKTEISSLKQTCNQIMSQQNYDDTCLKRCLNIKKDLNIWNEIVERSDFDAECGFSKRLLYWITNIVRWIKYIIPVAVIVLGILDFIKAVGADKDDELKKAQGRFVKRLIAAALIFIIPFILEFVLDKMGFTEYISGCGIIDL